MRARRVVAADELAQAASEMALVDHDQVVETLAANRPDHTLGQRVRLELANKVRPLLKDKSDSTVAATPERSVPNS